eukprot:CAMPEP_0115347018 /NCGR_PEP_ID=MMETSP0270-20121206/94654_1 /TAXON_ID=71861 /ORGANISM="Scrippsiella trochoidea, Strain CCMP3099" /LENGTH=221 /DNA_ID=CAMNT_0002768907 /DNA_START=48 /DNA_END=713 /DNA_ORIENTATION=+
MFVGCCCAKDEPHNASVDDGKIVQDMPRKEVVMMPEMPRAAEKEIMAPPPVVDPPVPLMRPPGSTPALELPKDSKKEHGSSSLPYGPGSTFSVTIVRSSSDPIGLDIDLIDGISAVVVDIKEGAVHSWNEKNPEIALKLNDRIIEVNGARLESNSIVSRLKSDTTWALQVQRPSEFAVSISRAEAEWDNADDHSGWRRANARLELRESRQGGSQARPDHPA